MLASNRLCYYMLIRQFYHFVNFSFLTNPLLSHSNKEQEWQEPIEESNSAKKGKIYHSFEFGICTTCFVGIRNWFEYFQLSAFHSLHVSKRFVGINFLGIASLYFYVCSCY